VLDAVNAFPIAELPREIFRILLRRARLSSIVVAVIRADTRLSMTMNPKSIIIYSLLYCTNCWCATDSQDVTTLSGIDDDADPEMAAGSTTSDNIAYNLTTESPLPVTTMNEYFVSGSSSSTSIVSRDRMSPVSSHNVNHKDKPKSEEVSSLNK